VYPGQSQAVSRYQARPARYNLKEKAVRKTRNTITVFVAALLLAGCSGARQQPQPIPSFEERIRDKTIQIEAKIAMQSEADNVEWRPASLVELSEFAIFTAADPPTTVNMFIGFANEMGEVGFTDSLHYSGKDIKIEMRNMEPYAQLTTAMHACNVEDGHIYIWKQLRLIARP
jgi:hypothetical protein